MGHTDGLIALDWMDEAASPKPGTVTALVPVPIKASQGDETQDRKSYAKPEELRLHQSLDTDAK